MEDDFARWMPSSVRLHTNRLYRPAEPPKHTEERLQAYGDHVEETARLIAIAPVDVIAFGCTSGSFLHGLGYDLEISKRIEAASGGVKAVVTARAAVDALNELGVRKVAAASPYTEGVNARLQKYLTEAGFEVVNSDHVDGEERGGIDDLAPEVAFSLGKRVYQSEAEAIFISCTAFRAAEVIDELEEAVGKPVVTANQATFWACMRVLGITDSIPGAGILLRERMVA